MSFSCTKGYLSVYTDYYSHENLASYIVHTPDPLLLNPPIGQRLIISWTMPAEHNHRTDVYLQLKVRYRNRKECSKTIPLCGRKGTHIFAVMNEEYRKTKGILTYKIEMFAGDCLIEEWKHQLWSELITFPTNDASKTPALPSLDKLKNIDFDE
jgi:hypothetical protein